MSGVELVWGLNCIQGWHVETVHGCTNLTQFVWSHESTTNCTSAQLCRPRSSHASARPHTFRSSHVLAWPYALGSGHSHSVLWGRTTLFGLQGSPWVWKCWQKESSIIINAATTPLPPYFQTCEELCGLNDMALWAGSGPQARDCAPLT